MEGTEKKVAVALELPIVGKTKGKIYTKGKVIINNFKKGIVMIYMIFAHLLQLITLIYITGGIIMWQKRSTILYK